MNGVPAHIARLQARGGLGQAALGGLGGDFPPRLSIRSNMFTLIDSAGNTTKVGAMDPKVGLSLDVVIFDANEHVSKSYRPVEEKWDEDNPAPPTCWSWDGIKPDDQSTKKQAEHCVDCQFNRRGSAVSPNGAAIKACRDEKKLAILIPGFDTAYQYTVTPGSMANYRAYLKLLDGHKVDVRWVTTRMFFSGTGVVNFTTSGYINEQVAGLVEKALDAKAGDYVVGRSSTPPALPAAAPIQQIAAPEPVFAPQEPDAPKKRGRPAGSKNAVRANETVVEAGPIPDSAFFRPERAMPARQETSFGVATETEAPPAELDDALDAIFNMSTE